MLPEFLKNENTIFHYTKTDTAIKYILPTKTLLFSPRKNSKDPIESKEMLISQSIHITDRLIGSRTGRRSQELYYLIKDRINSNNQISFCKNMISSQVKEYGYQKSRMWNQYADDFKGVCLAFDQQLLLQNSERQIISGNIKYLSYDDLGREYLEIDSNYLDQYGVHYENDLFELTDYLLLRKHVDYEGECEFRICSFGTPEYFTIKKSLLGILVCTKFLSTFNYIILKQYAENLNIPLFNVSLSSSGFRVTIEPNCKNFQIFHPFISD